MPSKNKSGSSPHRAPVLNYYYQICGTKRWTTASLRRSFGELDKVGRMVNVDDAKMLLEHPESYRGYTEPGDVLLNPPFVWHFVQTASGFHFAVTFKDGDRFKYWRTLYDMDPFLEKYLRNDLKGLEKLVAFYKKEEISSLYVLPPPRHHEELTQAVTQDGERVTVWKKDEYGKPTSV